MVLFLNYKTYVIKDERTNSAKAQGAERKIYTSHAATHDAKNRHGLPDELPLSWDAIKHLFETPAKPIETPKAAPITPPQSVPLDEMRALDKLRHLMMQSEIAADELMAVIAKRGFYPAGTPIESLKDDFILGMLLPQWARVCKFVEDYKKGALV